ncbi:MAG: Gfo/Idh/MocA family oxidoreductase [Clostridia bacterium]|jgi:predicted dehydrogenase|nr:Gfo/Idh/MocA family oxidoreductase [Clostridia bacterium]
MKKLKVGVMGLGWNGMLFCEKYSSNPDCELVAVSEHKPERRAEAVKKFGVKGYSEYEILEDKDIDVISIHTPDHVHVEPFVKALEAGKHVFVEKPLANDLEGVKTMVSASLKHSGQVQLVGQILRFGKYFEAVKKWIDEGVLGEICYLESDYIHDLRYQQHLEQWKVDKEVPMLGGGCHSLDLLRWLAKDVCGDVTKVSAMSHHISYKEMKADTSIVTNYKFKSGAIAKVATLYGGPTPRPFGFNLSVFGTKGAIVRDRLCLDGMGEESMNIPEMLYDPTFDFAPEVAHFVDCIKTGNTQTRVTPQDAAQTVLAAIAGSEAALKQQTLDIPNIMDVIEA